MIRDFVEKSVHEHLSTFNGDEMRDFIDVYIAEMNKEKDPESSFYRETGLENLIQTLIDLFLAG
jgi:hypothetical protein